MEKLEDIIKEEIRIKGRITFERFMELALYHPEYGYYSSGAASIGKSGDFYTSSQATRMFGTLVAEAYVRLASASGPDFVEAGAGEGLFALDMLTALRRSHPDEFDKCRYFIVESAAGMAEKQKARLAEFNEKVFWTEGLEDLKEIEGVIFSNELFDALPFHRVKQEQDRLKEIYVVVENGKLALVKGFLSTPDLATHFNRLMLQLPEGMETEVNLRVSGWMGSLGTKLKKGFVITVDYGYPAAQYYSDLRMRGTALCHYKHSLNEDFLERVGEQDITAHVDFTTVTLEGKYAGLKPELFCDQGQFLTETLPWFEQSMKRAGAPLEELVQAGQGIKTLIHPEWLGGVFKVLVQSKDCSLGGLFEKVRNKAGDLNV